MVFFCVQLFLGQEVIVRFSAICGIVDNHCLKILFIIDNSNLDLHVKQITISNQYTIL